MGRTFADVIRFFHLSTNPIFRQSIPESFWRLLVKVFVIVLHLSKRSRLGPDPITGFEILPIKAGTAWPNGHGITAIIHAVFSDGIKKECAVGIWMILQGLSIVHVYGHRQ